MSQIPGAIVIGGYINGLGLVRSLAARGAPLAVGSTEPYDIAQHSVHVREHLTAEGGADDLVDRLLRRTDWTGRVLFPTTDAALAAVTSHRERIERQFRIVAPPPEAAAVILDKQLMTDAAESVGIATPRCYGLAESGNPALETVRYPVIVKPIVGYPFTARFGCKMFEARDRAELDAAIAKAHGAGLACRLFDRVPGRDDQIFAHCVYVDRAGRPSAGVTIRKLRQSPPFFGVARAAEIVKDPRGLRDQTLALLARIGFRGMAAAEFKFDARDGSYRFMEVNGRSVIYNQLLRRAGLDVAAMAMDDLEGGLAAARPTGWNGAWINLLADLGYSIASRKADPISLAEFAAPYRRPVQEASWSAADPWPFAAQWLKTISGSVSRAKTRP